MPRLKATLAVVYKQVLILNHESSTHKPLCHMLAPIRIRASRWPSSLCSFATNRATILRASRLKSNRALWVILKLLTVPEQVDTQGQFLERRTQTRVCVPALLHDFMYLCRTPQGLRQPAA